MKIIRDMRIFRFYFVKSSRVELILCDTIFLDYKIRRSCNCHTIIVIMFID